MSTVYSNSYAILDLFAQLDQSPLWKKAMKDVKARAALPGKLRRMVTSPLCILNAGLDIKHRRGLKEAHQTFDAIRVRLDSIYASAQACGNLKKMASVVVLISQMCVDTLLSSKFMAAGQYFSVCLFAWESSTVSFQAS